ncbi:hypothetical protein ID866_3202 [Astraeus odoratus]|nr:hypothetical protein ID866_3202 [Astraeus odoratus]
MSPKRLYETVFGYFIQDNPEPTVNGGPHLRELLPRFGLIDDSPERWIKFKASIKQLNANAPSNIQYKVFFLGRHGQGYRLFIVVFRIWTSYWSRLNGDGELTWGPDPDLTPIGEGDARAARALWEAELQCGLPFPEKLYCSPLTRAIQTNQLTFKGLVPDGRKTTIVEHIREEIACEPCNKRRSRTDIQRRFPEYLIEEGFTEEDEIWRPDDRETLAEIEVRARAVLDMIFENDKEHFISITTHFGFIAGFSSVIGHAPWNLPPGGLQLRPGTPPCTNACFRGVTGSGQSVNRRLIDQRRGGECIVESVTCKAGGNYMPSTSSTDSDDPDTDSLFDEHPVAVRTVPPIPGLFVPPVLLTRELEREVVGECMLRYFEGRNINQIMLFGRSISGSEGDDIDARMGKGLPPFLVTLLHHLSKALRSCIPDTTYALLFPQKGSPPRARQAILNLYKPGEGITPHVDLLSRFDDGIIGVSFGSGCVMSFEKVAQEGDDPDSQGQEGDAHIAGQRDRWDLYLPERSILVLSRDARYTWTHGIPNRTHDTVEDECGGDEPYLIKRGTRLSITFRWLLPGADIVGGPES